MFEMETAEARYPPSHHCHYSVFASKGPGASPSTGRGLSQLPGHGQDLHGIHACCKGRQGRFTAWQPRVDESIAAGPMSALQPGASHSLLPGEGRMVPEG